MVRVSATSARSAHSPRCHKPGENNARVEKHGIRAQLRIRERMQLPCNGSGRGVPYRITGLDAADHWEIKAIAKNTVAGDERMLEAPLIDLAAPVAPGLEMSATFGRGRLHAAGQSARTGAIDTELAVKWEMVPIGPDGTIGITVEPALIAPTGTSGLSDDTWFAEVPLVIGWNRGVLRLRGLAGYGRSLASDQDEISLGGLVEYQVLPTLSVGLEVVSTTPSDSPDRRWKSMVDVGFKYELSSTVELQARFGRSVCSAGEPAVTQGAIYLEIALKNL